MKMRHIFCVICNAIDKSIRDKYLNYSKLQVFVCVRVSWSQLQNQIENEKEIQRARGILHAQAMSIAQSRPTSTVDRPQLRADRQPKRMQKQREELVEIFILIFVTFLCVHAIRSATSTHTHYTQFDSVSQSDANDAGNRSYYTLISFVCGLRFVVAKPVCGRMYLYVISIFPSSFFLLIAAFRFFRRLFLFHFFFVFFLLCFIPIQFRTAGEK